MDPYITTGQSEEDVEARDTILEYLDPLSLDIPDETLIEYFKKRLKSFDNWKNDIDLEDRQKKNKEYYIGNQINLAKVPKYSIPYMENLIWEAVARNAAIAISRLPDLIAKPGNKSDESRITAETLTEIINSDVQKRANKKVLKLAYKQRKVYFYSVVKAVWNREKGDFEYVNVHPGNAIFDHRCKTNDVDKMSYFGENMEITVEELIAKFPDKEKAIYNELGWKSGEETKKKNMATSIKYWEVWFDDKIKKVSEDGKKSWVNTSGVFWKYKNLVLKKMRNPYWDWEGEEVFIKREVEEDEAEALTEDDVFQQLFGKTESSKIFRNHFRQPKKPYFLMTFTSFGEHPIDISTDIEQVLYFQDNVNDEGRQITDMNRRSRPKHVFSQEALDKKTVEDLDTNNPDQSIVTNGDLRSVYTTIQSSPAPKQLYESKYQNRSIAFEIMALNATTRGVRESGDETLGARQMMREQDFGLIDDEVDDTINACAEWMGGWDLQMIKRFYTKEKLKSYKGKRGELVFTRINQDVVEDGMEVEVYASGVDKQKRKVEAFEMAKLKMIDPYNFYKDMGAADPEGRTRDLILSSLSPALYLKTVVESTTPGQLTQELAAIAQQPSPNPQMQPQQQPQPPQQM